MPRDKLSQPVRIPDTPIFKSFEDKEDFLHIPGYSRNLPHWRFIGATYFVTFRLADSIPQEVAHRWKREESQWLFEHGVEPASASIGSSSIHTSAPGSASFRTGSVRA
jgi:hypothetical protein